MRQINTRQTWLLTAISFVLTACAALPPTDGPKTGKTPAPVVSRSPTPASPPAAARPVPPSPVTPPAAEAFPPVFDAPADSAPVPPVLAPAPAAPASPAVLALLDTAGRHEQGGQLESAAATLERAVRVDPRNASVWYRLARIRLAQGQWQAAANLAAKSNSLAGGDTELQKRNWQLIAQARERLGDKAGAQAARSRAAKH